MYFILKKPQMVLRSFSSVGIEAVSGMFTVELNAVAIKVLDFLTNFKIAK